MKSSITRKSNKERKSKVKRIIDRIVSEYNEFVEYNKAVREHELSRDDEDDLIKEGTAIYEAHAEEEVTDNYISPYDLAREVFDSYKIYEIEREFNISNARISDIINIDSYTLLKCNNVYAVSYVEEIQNKYRRW